MKINPVRGTHDLFGEEINKFNKVVSGVDNLVQVHKELEKKRYDLDFDVDGLVYKINNLELQNRLGFVANAPRWAIAHKFSADSSFSKILNIEIQIGRTGALTPVAKVKPVNIGGCLLYTSPSPRDGLLSRMPSSA